MQDNRYFAAQPSEETASELLSKAEFWFQQLDSTGYVQKLRESWRAYHGAYYGDGHRIQFGGEQGELAHVAVNHYRNIASHMLTMVTANRPAMTARSTNTDYKSLVQTKLANGLLDYYMREKRLEKYLKTAVEYAIVLGSGYIKMEWNATSGEIWDYNEETQTPIYEGDVQFSNLSPFDVVFDSTKETAEHDWVVTRSFKNKYDLAAKYPEFYDEISALPTKSDIYKFRFDVMYYTETDDVPVYEFYHKRSEALPNGRYMLFLSNDIVLYDDAMPYRSLPVYRIAPGDVLGTPYGYTPMFDLLPIQDAINSLYSTILTNQSAFGVQNILNPRGSDVVVSQLAGALNVIDYNPGVGKPEALNLTYTPKEVFDFLRILENAAETVSGVNSVARGQPEPSLRSGNALALIQSMALQFMSGLQQNYVQIIEDVGTGLINMLKDFAATPRVAAIVGKDNRTALKEFTGDDLALVNRVIVDLGNPLAQTKAGRVQMAENLLQYQRITPEQYFTVLNTGNLEVMTDSIQRELFLVKAENEKLIDGQPVKAMDIDEHLLHIKEHKCVLSDPDLRMDEELAERVLNHIKDHINALREVDPGLLQIIGETPLPPVAPPPGDMGDMGPVMDQPQTPQQELQENMTANLPAPPAPFDQEAVLPQDMPAFQGG